MALARRFVPIRHGIESAGIASPSPVLLQAVMCRSNANFRIGRRRFRVIPVCCVTNRILYPENIRQPPTNTRLVCAPNPEIDIAGLRLASGDGTPGISRTGRRIDVLIELTAELS